MCGYRTMKDQGANMHAFTPRRPVTQACINCWFPMTPTLISFPRSSTRFISTTATRKSFLHAPQTIPPVIEAGQTLIELNCCYLLSECLQHGRQTSTVLKAEVLPGSIASTTSRWSVYMDSLKRYNLYQSTYCINLDVKSENILLSADINTDNPIVKLSDLGLGEHSASFQSHVISYQG